MIGLREMEMPLVFLLLNIFLIFSAFQVQESSGLNLPYSVPEILSFKDLKFYFKNQMNGSSASSPAPRSHPHHHHPSKSPWKRKWHSISPKMPESPSPQPMISPSSLHPKKHIKAPSPFLTLPSPPPNQDCSSLICAAPLTLGPPGSPCGCVWPIEVGLHLSTTLYTFFPLVSEFAKELSVGLSLNGSQVRIMGANAANLEMQKTAVILNLVPQDDQFDASTAYSIYMKLWKREVFVRTSLFGMYQVLYVRYPGLPPSPPALSASASATISSEPYRGGVDGEGMTIKPLGVEVPRRKKNGLKGTMIMVIVLSSITTSVVCIAFIWLLLSKFFILKHEHSQTEAPRQQPSVSALSMRHESHPSIASVSQSSSILPYTGTAKIFTIAEMERATESFRPSNVIGEGGFGIVYRGILDDGSLVAVKVLKRDDRQGTREFLAEVEMLNRLHHRNLVQLIGICNDAHCRCLVYELVPNGSVESHLHGVDKETGPLDWCARMKIALGAARGLAYLHEDSSPRVIHRDFKSSNILLEHDFTPKVSDFGLARAAFEEQSKHISTHVMGTFGYLAPEYAMTGHLLVKSDVYSYGVVLLELLTGRKPVDLSQPSGQENLVSWARPLLTSNEGLEAMLDPSLSPNISFNSVVKFAAIASMCVQPEVSHRPFMGEVVQALKLVCNEIEEIRMLTSRTCSQNEFSGRISVDPEDDDGEAEVFRASFDGKRAFSTSQFGRVESESFRRQFNSAPLKMERKRRFWERLRGLSKGSMSEHGSSLM